MPVKLWKLDAFGQIEKDARIRTASGGALTIFSYLIILFLVITEWRDYRTVILRPELVVDKARDESMEIHMNITFPRIPCDFMTLDVGDASGHVQLDVLHGVQKVRLAAASAGGMPIEKSEMELHTDEAKHLDPDYCGSCYGAPPPTDGLKDGCCNTCAEVRQAYAAMSWSFGRGENVEQCGRERYNEQLEAHKTEGCRLEGAVRVNKVPGSFHFVPGPSFTRGAVHLHDIGGYAHPDGPHTIEHHIHHLRFGPRLPEQFLAAVSAGGSAAGSASAGFSNTLLDINPLDNTAQRTEEKMRTYTYFVKVVSTVFLPLQVGAESERFVRADAPVGLYGIGPKGEVEAHQYSVTMHQRSLGGGRDKAEDHAERVHSRGGLPGLFFEYDISPIKVINRQVRPKSFINFLVAACASIGGTLTVAAMVDQGLHTGLDWVRRRARS